MTKRDTAIVERYENATARTLYDVYDNFSYAKANAFEYCKRLMADKNGRGLKILGANCFMFTAAFKYEVDGVEYLMYITKNEDRPIKIG